MMKKQCTIMISAIMILLFVFTGCQSKPVEVDMDTPKVIGVLNHEQAWEQFTDIFGSGTRGADGFVTECNDDLDGDGNADYVVMDSYGSTVTVELSGKGKIIADSAELNVNGDKWGKDFIAFGADVTGDDQREIILLINIGQQGPEGRCGLFVYEKSGDEYKPLSAPTMAFPVTVEWDCEMLAVYRRFTADMESEKEGYSVMVSDAAGMETYYAVRDNQKRWLEIKDTPITNDLAAFEYCDAMPTYINGKPALALCQYVKGPDAESWERLGYFVTIITWDDKGKYEITDEFFAAPLFAQLAANKDGSNSINSVTETKSEVWKETYTAGGWLPVTADVAMDIPLYVNYPVYKVEYYDFTTEKLNRTVETVMGSVSDIKLAEDYSETKSAPETQFSPMAKYTCKDEAGNQWKVVTRESNTTISAYANNEYVIQSEETVLAGNAYTGEPAGTTLDNIKISQEEAIQEVQDVMDELGICNMRVSHAEKARMLDPSNNTLTEGWYLRYMRCDGDRDTLPFLTSHTVFTDFENEFEPLRKERLLIFVDETGIVSFSWYSPSQQISSITDTQPPLTFAEAKDSIKAAIEEIAIVTKDNYSPECTLTIKNIMLSNCVVQSEFESYTGYLLPTWIVEFVIDHGDGWTDNEQLYINSIDGSKLSDFCMTEAGGRIAQNYDNDMYYE